MANMTIGYLSALVRKTVKDYYYYYFFAASYKVWYKTDCLLLSLLMLTQSLHKLLNYFVHDNSILAITHSSNLLES